MKQGLIAVILIFSMLLLYGCGSGKNSGYENPEEQGVATDMGSDDKSFGESLDDLGAFDGYFEDEASDVSVSCISGTPSAYVLEGGTLTFTGLSEDSSYSISGKLRGCIVIDVGDEYKLELELCGFSLVSESSCPIYIQSGNKVSLKAKNQYDNYIYDMREAVDADIDGVYAGAVHSKVDIEICGRGALNVVSENNNGIHSADDLEVKNLTLLVSCKDNALKGNDSVRIENATTTLIATTGDGIKTTRSDVSDKGNQRGNVDISGGTHNVYAACDGIDAAHDVNIDEMSTIINIYTDKYSNYSEEVTRTSSSECYIRFTSNAYSYSVKYYNSDSDYAWVNAEYHSSVAGGRSSYYYYSFPRLEGYDKLQFFIYSSDMTQGQESEYLAMSDLLEPNEAYDTFALSSRGGSLSYSWTNYTTQISEGGFGGPGAPGGMNDGNSEKGEYSTKGIKAANRISVTAGTINIKSYDDAIHANNDGALENGENPLGDVSISGGNISIYTNDDGLHADGTLKMGGGTVTVLHSYEGAEGEYVIISGGYLSVISTDDGINATAVSGTAVAVSGGTVYVYSGGDGIDSNSRTSYSGIEFSGGNTVVISTSGGNSAIDTESGYSYTGGAVLAIMPRGGMSNEATHCDSFSSVGKSTQLSLTKDQYLIASISGGSVTVNIPVAMSAYVIILGDTSPELKLSSTASVDLDSNGVGWEQN